jgi:GNAT superfamily N-acetyltransferase
VTVDGYTVRLARAPELALLPAIERRAAERFATYPHDLGIRIEDAPPTSLEALHAANDDGRVLVAADDAGTPVGFALMTDLGLFAHLEEMDVQPEHGGKGLGAALIEAVCAWANRHGFTAVTLSTFRDVPWNAPFYARHGFAIVEPDDLPPELLRVVEAERGRGLRTDLRVIMQRAV